MLAQAKHVTPALMQRQDCYKFEASLGYVLSSRPARVRMKGSVSLPTYEGGAYLINKFVLS